MTIATSQNKPAIRLKALELIAQKIGDLDNGGNLVSFLKKCGVDDGIIVYPNTKWRMVFDVLVYLASSKKHEDQETLSRVIGEATHPLMHKGDELAASILRKQFDAYLKYDNMGIAYDENTGTYLALRLADDEEDFYQAQMESDDLVRRLEEQSEKQLEFLSKSENKEKISLLQKAYQLLMNVVFFFCDDPTRPTAELNQSFQYLNKLVNITVNELRLSIANKSPFSRNEHFFYLPFSSLFSAEKIYKEQGKELSWQRIRPEMNAMYGNIEEIYQEVGGSDVLAKPDLSEIELFLSMLKKKRKVARKIQTYSKRPAIPTTRIEITKLPELQIKGFEEKVILQKPKNKSVQIPNFPKDLRWEQISIRFLNEHEVIIKAADKQLQSTYELMGFQDEKRKLPNKQWVLLRSLAMKNGELSWENNNNMSLQETNSVKKQKQLLATGLKAYFQISNDPFEDYKKEKAYKIKLSLFIENSTPVFPNQEDTYVDDLGIEAFRKEHSPEVYDE